MKVGGQTLASAVSNLTLSKELQCALKICMETSRPDSSQPVDSELVHRDVMGTSLISGIIMDEKSDVRGCRMHWHREHWRQVQAAYCGTTGQLFIDRINSKKEDV